jgi:DNA helicase-2/ATP-dependent DNA helicase PcrA
MSANKVIVAGAGAGKTTYIVREAIQNKDKRTLITTYTQANEGEIRNKFIEENGCVPDHVTIQTWFSFLLQDGVRPYQGRRFKSRIGRLVLVSGISAMYVKETEDKHYLTDDGLVYSDKIAKLAISCNMMSDGAVIMRLEDIYDVIYVDELQDITGNDLDFLKLIAASSCDLIMVGDPRQGTYSTNNASKNKKVRKDKTKVVDFFVGDNALNISVDSTTLGKNYRCHSTICDLSNKLYPTMTAVTSGYSATERPSGAISDQKGRYDSIFGQISANAA